MLINDSVLYFDGLVQELRNSIANALKLCLSCTNPSIYGSDNDIQNGRRDLEKYRGTSRINPCDAETGISRDN